MKMLVERKFAVVGVVGGGQGFGTCKNVIETFDTEDEANAYKANLKRVQEDGYKKGFGFFIGWYEVEPRDTILKVIG